MNNGYTQMKKEHTGNNYIYQCHTTAKFRQTLIHNEMQKPRRKKTGKSIRGRTGMMVSINILLYTIIHIKIQCYINRVHCMRYMIHTDQHLQCTCTGKSWPYH